MDHSENDASASLHFAVHISGSSNTTDCQSKVEVKDELTVAMSELKTKFNLFSIEVEDSVESKFLSNSIRYGVNISANDLNPEKVLQIQQKIVLTLDEIKKKFNFSSCEVENLAGSGILLDDEVAELEPFICNFDQIVR